MSSKRYIDLYSANRDRSLYPKQAQFVVPFTNSGPQLGALQAQDPITTGPIYYTWQGDFFNITGNTKTGTTDGNVLLGTPSATYGFGFSGISNFYKGAEISVNGVNKIIYSDNPPNISVVPNIAYNGLNTLGGDPYEIKDPSSGDNATPTPFIYIPSADSEGNTILSYSQAYRGYWIVDETMCANSTGEIVARKIIDYDWDTQRAYLDSPFPTGWTVRDFMSLRKTLPYSRNVLLACSPGKIRVEGNFGNIPSLPNGTYTQGYNIGSYIYITPFYDSTITSPYPPDNIITTGDFFLNCNKSYYIDSLVVSGGGTVYEYNIIGGPQLPTLPLGTTAFSINFVSFVKDNAVPLMYTGSLVSQNSEVCYEISLINLSLPNVVLKTGGRIAFYPFVYVEFSGMSSTGASGNVIYSNNPDSTKALFIAPVTDIAQPVNSTFLKIDSGAMTQTVKFKPNDSLRFSVFLPNGELFEPVQEDYLSPYPSNLLLQIDANFSIKRL